MYPMKSNAASKVKRDFLKTSLFVYYVPAYYLLHFINFVIRTVEVHHIATSSTVDSRGLFGICAR